MSEAFLFILMLCFGVYHAYSEYEHRKEVKHLLRTAMAKSLQEVVAVEKMEQHSESEAPEPDVTPMSADHPDLFDAAIKQQLEHKDE